MRALLVGAVQVWSWEQAVSLYCHRFVIHSVDRYAFHCVFLENIVASRVKGRDLRALFFLDFTVAFLLFYSNGIHMGRL